MASAKCSMSLRIRPWIWGAISGARRRRGYAGWVLPPLLPSMTSMTTCTSMPSRDTRRMRSTALSRLDMVMALLRSFVTWAATRGPHEGDGAGERGEDRLAHLVRRAVTAGRRGQGAGPGSGTAAVDGGVEVGDALPGQVPGNLAVLPRVAGPVVDDDQAATQGVFHARGP